MMRSVVVVLLLLLGVGAAIFLTQRSDYTEPDATPDAIALLRGANTDEAREIRISKGDSEVVLLRQGADWVLPEAWGYGANGNKVKEFLEEIGDISDPEVRATSIASHANFEVDGDNGRKIEIHGDGKGLPIRLTLGKFSAPGRSYLLTSGDDRVYEVRTELSTKASLYSDVRRKDWLALDVFEPVDGKDVVRVVLETTDGRVELERVEEQDPPTTSTPKASTPKDSSPNGDAAEDEPDSSGWRVTHPETFDTDPDNTHSLVSRTTRALRAYDAVDPKGSDYGLTEPERRFELHYDDGSFVAIRFGKDEMERKETAVTEKDAEAGDAADVEPELTSTGRVYVQREGDPRVFTIQTWARDGFFKSLDALRPTEPAIEPETGEGDSAGPPVGASGAPGRPTTRTGD